ncbi:hypothetical protein BH09PSE6_BH09PSE6_05030 [soil metagenome]
MKTGFRLEDHPVVQLRPHVTHPYAWVGHIPFMYLVADLLRPRRFVELGTDSGNSYLAFCQAVAYLGTGTECHAIDSWEGDEHARHYGEHIYRALRGYHDPLYGSFSHLNKSLFDDALRQFADRSVDLLHIDGLHTYEAVSHDFESWLPKLSETAVVLFHDSAVTDRGFGVRQFVDELRERYDIFEFTHSNGLAVLRLGTHTTQGFDAFLEEANSDPSAMQEQFEAAAATLIDPSTGELDDRVDAAERPVECMLYYRSESESFDESRSLSILHPGTRHAQFSFDIPDQQRPDFVRIDPAALPGIYRLVSIALRCGLSAVSVLAETTSSRITVHGEVLDGHGIDGIRLLALDDDPFFEIDLRSLWVLVEPGESVQIDVAVEYERVLSVPGMRALAIEASAVLARTRQQSGPDAAAARIDHLTALVSASKADVEIHLGQQDSKLDAILELLSTQHALVDAEIGRQALRMDALAAQVSAHHEAIDAEIKSQGQYVGTLLAQVQQAVAERDVTAGGSRNNSDRTGHDDESEREAARASELAARGRSSVLHAFDNATRARLATFDRKRVSFTAQLPVTALANLDYDSTRGSWIATNSDPQFEVASLSAFAGRWVSLMLAIEPADFWTSSPTLYFDHGKGCSEADSIELPVPTASSANIQHVVFIPVGTLAVRLDPMSQAGHFRIEGVTVTPLSKPRALGMMIKGLARREGRRSLLKWVVKELRPLPTPGRLRQLVRLIPQRYARVGSQLSYAHWIAAYEPAESGYAALAEAQSRWSLKPLISIVMPVYNTDRRILEAAIESVRRQVYPHFELCIADDASPDPKVRETLQRFAALDPRIRIVYREQNGHIVQASNSALELASGEFVALLDHDDLLHPLALHFVVDAINRFPDAGIVYSDEDKIDAFGLRYEPYFKSRFNYDLLLSQNMISHLGVYRRSLIEGVGGFREAFKGSQDYDLALRVVERIEPHQIIHIPRVLYHWRAIAGSTAVDSSEKPYAVVAAHAAVKDHLDRPGRNAEVLPAPEMPNYSRVRFELPEKAPHVTIIVPTRDRLDLLSMCIDSIIEKTQYPSYDIVIVDNGSVEAATHAYLDRLPRDRVTVVRDDRAFNFSALNNFAAASARGPLLCLLNNDIEVRQPEWLDELARLASRDDVGCVGARLWYPDERLQHGGVLLGIGGIASHSHKFLARGAAGYFGRAVLPQQLTAVTAACLMIRKTVYQEVGGFDEQLAVAFNDIDFCLRVVEAGYRNIWTPASELIHHESASRGVESSPEKVDRFNREVEFMTKRWRTALLSDAAYSPNLTLNDESFDMAWPPRDLAPGNGQCMVTREAA